ncbi:hypothetical protein DENSPDRAFT_885474 [Dentipellis sp. KUC8613]|nr:hypothetical protein DENSPDRAFT_885474 [Dentipellis sp. KUC8613]
MLRILKAPLGCLRALPSPLDAPLGCLRAQLGCLHSIAPSSAPAVMSAPHTAVFGPHGVVSLFCATVPPLPYCAFATHPPLGAVSRPPSCPHAPLLRCHASQQCHRALAAPSPSFYHQGPSLAALPAISCCGGPTVQAARPLAAPPAVLLLARLVIAPHVLAMAQAARHPTRLCQSIRAARALAMVRAAPPLAILPLAHRVAAPHALAAA